MVGSLLSVRRCARRALFQDNFVQALEILDVWLGLAAFGNLSDRRLILIYD